MRREAEIALTCLPGAAFDCELNRSMQHLSLKMKAEDVAYGQAPTTKILL